MELIKEFFWGIEPSDITKMKWNVRRAVRALVKHGDKMAVVKSTSHGFYKCLPGGGVDDNEDLHTALRREVREEVGCKIKIVDEIGMCVEYIGDHNLVSISFVFVTEVVGEIENTQFTDEEISDGFVLEWHSIEDTLSLIKNAKSIHKRGGEQMERERLILEHYLKNSN